MVGCLLALLEEGAPSEMKTWAQDYRPPLPSAYSVGWAVMHPILCTSVALSSDGSFIRFSRPIRLATETFRDRIIGRSEIGGTRSLYFLCRVRQALLLFVRRRFTQDGAFFLRATRASVFCCFAGDGSGAAPRRGVGEGSRNVLAPSQSRGMALFVEGRRRICCTQGPSFLLLTGSTLLTSHRVDAVYCSRS